MKSNYKWVLIVTMLAFIISLVMSLAVMSAFKNVTLLLAIVVTFLFILLGIIFDIIGVSATSSDGVAFHSMSARRVRGGKVGVMLCKNASKVSSICCDVVGDVCGIITGVSGVAIVSLLADKISLDMIYISVIVMSLISALTIGGKALGKYLAINKSTEVLTVVAKFLSIFSKN